MSIWVASRFLLLWTDYYKHHYSCLLGFSWYSSKNGIAETDTMWTFKWFIGSWTEKNFYLTFKFLIFRDCGYLSAKVLFFIQFLLPKKNCQLSKQFQHLYILFLPLSLLFSLFFSSLPLSLNLGLTWSYLRTILASVLSVTPTGAWETIYGAGIEHGPAACKASVLTFVLSLYC